MPFYVLKKFKEENNMEIMAKGLANQTGEIDGG
jgi:hypothetical protein